MWWRLALSSFLPEQRLEATGIPDRWKAYVLKNAFMLADECLFELIS
jgi:hypothetical protein